MPTAPCMVTGWLGKRAESSCCGSWTDVGGTGFTATPEQIGDAILARKDAPASYHLACVVDDAASRVTTVVRGEDLRPSTPTQRLLQALLDLPEPDLSPPCPRHS